MVEYSHQQDFADLQRAQNIYVLQFYLCYGSFSHRIEFECRDFTSIGLKAAGLLFQQLQWTGVAVASRRRPQMHAHHRF